MRGAGCWEPVLVPPQTAFLTVRHREMPGWPFLSPLRPWDPPRLQRSWSHWLGCDTDTELQAPGAPSSTHSVDSRHPCTGDVPGQLAVCPYASVHDYSDAWSLVPRRRTRASFPPVLCPSFPHRGLPGLSTHYTASLNVRQGSACLGGSCLRSGQGPGSRKFGRGSRNRGGRCGGCPALESGPLGAAPPPSGDAWLQEARSPRWLLLKPLPQVVSVAGLLRRVLPGKGSPPHWWHLY